MEKWFPLCTRANLIICLPQIQQLPYLPHQIVATKRLCKKCSFCSRNAVLSKFVSGVSGGVENSCVRSNRRELLGKHRPAKPGHDHIGNHQRKRSRVLPCYTKGVG